MSESGLILDSAAYRFPHFTLGPVSLRLERGRAYGLLGPNGAGKTTLLNLLAMQLQLKCGMCSWNGVPMVWGDPAWKSRLAYVHERPTFYNELTIDDTLRLAARLRNSWNAARSRALVERFGLSLTQRVGTLSKGSAVKLGIIAALAGRSEFLLLDEPTAGLDPDAREELHHLLRELLSEDSELTILLSSHLFEDTERIANEVLILRDGSLVFQESLAALQRMRIFKLSGTTDLESLREFRLAWRKESELCILVPDLPFLTERLRLLSGDEEPHAATLARVFRGTATIC